ncbi:family 78 glycoside hydrolase catalytic domain [Kribbella sp. CA-293567]|uniref:family 78 glycoside hydrolase catalytic domain n=1 Tax=Kribbella sp. CA-293567 TaxID=3002436 RepID=UPI0022DD133E|nr:family 78 glycoside hydrolase catalytic domain [Kribbella sp. CA-293567]WBQ05221.1 family 78 glycoside hydrolase catalytic domain [Kribbella sp. CA-293567]
MSVHTRLGCLLAAAFLLTPLLPATAAPPATNGATAAGTGVVKLKTNSLTNPLGIAPGTPRLSWQLDSARRATTQTKYEIHVASTAAKISAPDLWNSGVVASSRSVDVPYGGPALTPYTQYFWSVRVWDDTGTPSAWSPAATFETANLEPEDWRGDWIGADSQPGAEWTDYTIDADLTLTKDAVGVFFRGRGGNGYMWQLNQENDARPTLRPHVKLPTGYNLLGEIPLTGVNLKQRNHLKLTVAGPTISTWINDTLVDRRDRSDHSAPGLVGFRTSGVEAGVVHTLKVTNSAGTDLIDTAFPAGDQTFPEGTVLAAGDLQVKGTSDLWLPGKAIPVFRKSITLPAGKKVAKARMYAAAQGIYELNLNGQKVGDQELAPGWTDYNRRIQSQSYDVTRLIGKGTNTIRAELASGWFTGNLAMFGSNKYGSETALSAQLRVTYTDGSTDTFATDASWETAPGAVRAADLLNGETYDARRTPTDWSPVQIRPSATAKLAQQTDQPVRVTEELQAKAIASPTPGVHLYDLGQNMVGVGRVRLTGTPGQTVKIRYGEVLNPDGTLYTDNLRSAKATDRYTFATSGPETYQPRFTFHGFRYVELSGLPAAPPAGAITGVVMGTDGAKTSSLITNSPLVNKLHSNIVWGQRGNFLSVPTDTPARDERMGWTGDINVFARTAVYNLDSQAFLTKWLQDLRDSQGTNGAYASVAPTVPNSFDGGMGNAGWADAGVNVPWTLWQAYGDTSVISQHYDSMRRYVDYLVASSNGLIRGGGDYGDWLNLDDPTPGDLIGTSFVAKGARQLSQMAAAIGNPADAAKYQKVYEDTRTAFASRFVQADGKIGADSQTGYILAFTSDLVPADKLEAAGEHFANTILRRGTHLSTGFLGVDGLLPVLTKISRSDLAYKLLQNTSYPSWGYEIGKGATTIWERWNSINPDGTFNDVGMNSFNHYAYGAVGEWMYGTLAGVSAAEPGYRKAVIAPTPGNGIDSVDFRYQTPYGEIVSRWKGTADYGLTLDVTVPANTTATVRIPALAQGMITESGRSLESAEHVTNVVDEGATVAMTVASGTYRFVVAPAPVRLSATNAPVTGEPGTTTTVSTVVKNRSTSPVTGRLDLTVPAGWSAPASQPVTLAAGAQTTVTTRVAVPVDVNAAPVAMTAKFTDARGELASATVGFTVTQSLEPANAVDYVDLGEKASEEAHSLTAAPSSSTTMESGRTRRYAGMFVPGAWFEFNVGIKAGEPFVLRLVETFDKAQVKDYDVLVNGKVVKHRVINKSGAGLETYQFAVADPALLTGATVRVRIQHNATASGYDPSIADVWSLPLP